MPRKKQPIVIVETNPVETKPALNEKPISKTSKTTAKNSRSAKTTATITSLPTKTIAPKPKTITRIELTQEVARAINEHMEITNRDAEEIVSEIINSMIKALRSGDEIEIRTFGSFRVRTRRARNGRNPRTGERVAVASRSVVYFKMGKELRKSLLK